MWREWEGWSDGVHGVVNDGLIECMVERLSCGVMEWWNGEVMEW